MIRGLLFGKILKLPGIEDSSVTVARPEMKRSTFLPVCGLSCAQHVASPR